MCDRSRLHLDPEFDPAFYDEDRTPPPPSPIPSDAAMMQPDIEAADNASISPRRIFTDPKNERPISDEELDAITRIVEDYRVTPDMIEYYRIACKYLFRINKMRRKTL